MSMTLTRVYHVEDLSPEEKDRLLMLILDRLGMEMLARKYDGEARTIELHERERT